ncbi:MAG: serine/threonine-protein kinase [Deltaproteobacteria bacterium]|nr:serine/threonine-protein kinase [Deltaproteobacteria bacterium]
MTEVDELLGRVLGGRFRLLRRLGQGGMGAVYEAVDLGGDLNAAARTLGDETAVALKVIKANLVDDKDAIKRFQREARAVGGLKHPHIVGFIAAGDDDGVHWLAMELLEGSDLKERIASRGAMPWRETLPLLRQMCLGLQAAHEHGVIHRDLKPENVMLTGRPGVVPHVKLLDFGIAKQADVDGMTATGTGIVVGTPGFVAPEVIVEGITDDPRSDLYSVGVVWFEMLTATKPFDAPTPFALAMLHVQQPPPRPTSVLPFSPVPAPVEELLLRLLEKRPGDRPASAAELVRLLDELQAQAERPIEPASSRRRTETDLRETDKTETNMLVTAPTGPGIPRATDAPTLSDHPLAVPPSSSSWRPLLMAAIVAVIGVGIAFASVNAAKNRKPPDPIAVVVVDAGTPIPPIPPVVAVVVVDAGPAEVLPVIVDAGTTKAVDAGVRIKKKKPDAGVGDVGHKPQLLNLTP